MKKPGLPSPDAADAFVLTFAEVGRGRQKVRRARQTSWRVTCVRGGNEPGHHC